jgi:ATP-dependent RNA helicase DeaD
MSAEEATAKIAFKDLGLAAGIQQAIDELGFEEPTPIQEQAIPELLGGHDVIGQAQTGTGKTAAFGLPLLQYLDPDNDEVQAIVLTPTRELCIQVTQALRAYAEHLDVEIVAVFGGAPIKSQQAQLRAGAQVVVATVGRMMDLMSRRSLVLTAARYVVLDEADEMLDLGFIEDVEKILRMCPSGRQTALFSATMPPPVQKLAEGYMYDPTTISITPKKLTVDAIAQAFIEVPAKEKAVRLVELLKTEEPEQAIIFCRTKIGASRLERTLKDKGLDVKALHGDLSQGVRDGVMIAFKDHRVRLLVATDIAARGLDIEHVTHVINYDVPASSEVYVHRIGRTGRVGRTGRAITLVTPAQRDEIDRIERDVKTSIGEWESPEERLEHAPRPRRRERKRDKPPAETAEKVEAPGAEKGDDEPAEREKNGGGDAKSTKLFVNRGERSGIEEEDLRWALREGAVLPEDAIHDVRVLHRFSFVEVAPDQADRAVEFLDGTKLKGKEIRLEIAKS